MTTTLSDSASSTEIRIDRLRLPTGPELEYVERGSRGGPTLLLLHGITDSWRSFEPVLPYLPSHWHVLALTQRGHGGSDKPANGYRTRDFAHDAAVFAQALGLPPLVVVGHSMGAANAMRLAIDHPSMVRGLIAAGAFASFGSKPELVDFVSNNIAPLTDSIPRDLAQAFQQDTIARPIVPGLLETAVAESLRAPAFVWRQAFAGLLEDDFCEDISRIACPTLLVQGSADAFVPATDTTRLLEQLPQARASVWPGAGHAMHWEEPARFADELIGFVNALPA